MGYPMAQNILKAGFNLTAFNRTNKKAQGLSKNGAEVVNSIKEAVEKSEIIITILSDDDAVLSVISNKDFLENIKKNSIVIDMSSTNKNGNLAIMVGGQKEVFNKALNLLNTMGNPTLVGPIGCGQIAKLANQIIVGVTIGAVAEAIHLCKKSGADPNKFIKAVEGGFADSKILKNHGKKMIENNFEPGGKTSTHLKDMNNILESAESFNFKLPISKLIKEMYQDLVDNNHSEKDHSSLYIQIEELNRNGK